MIDPTYRDWETTRQHVYRNVLLLFWKAPLEFEFTPPHSCVHVQPHVRVFLGQIGNRKMGSFQTFLACTHATNTTIRKPMRLNRKSTVPSCKKCFDGAIHIFFSSFTPILMSSFRFGILADTPHCAYNIRQMCAPGRWVIK
jgi:hypothetical protein